MIEERQPVRAHKISLLNRNLGVITGVKDVVSFELNEIILDTDQGLLMIKGIPEPKHYGGFIYLFGVIKMLSSYAPALVKDHFPIHAPYREKYCFILWIKPQLISL